MELELERRMLIQIEKDHRGDNERCKYEMLDRWLRNAKQPTWKAMADALCLIGEHRVALNIRTKYCSSSTATGMSVYSCSKHYKAGVVTCIHGRRYVGLLMVDKLRDIKPHRKMQCNKRDYLPPPVSNLL